MQFSRGKMKSPDALVIKKTRLVKIIALSVLAGFGPGLAFGLSLLPTFAQETFLGQKFTREENLLLNLRTGQGSAGYFLLEALSKSKELTHDLERAMSRIEAVEKTYAKSKGRPDDKYMASTELKLTQARQRSEELTGYISDTFQDMKKTIKETLIKN